jgi:hypothetical protein
MGSDKKLNGATGPQQPVNGDKGTVAPARAAGDINTPKPPEVANAPVAAKAPEAKAPDAKAPDAKAPEVKGAEAPRTANPTDAAQPPKAADKPKPEDVLKKRQSHP